jgi:hypothetical protein
MNEQRLREELRDASVPGASEAEDRAWRIIGDAWSERAATTGLRPRWRRRLTAAGAVAAAALVAAGLVLTPAGAAVREWIGDTIDPGRDDAKPALTRLPADGDLLVSSAAGSWIVHPDGSKRLLGDYSQASWSPHGLYVAVASDRELAAVDPKGELRWSIERHRISDPRWSPNEGYRIAYRSGGELRVIWGDGANDEALAPSAPVAPAWQPRTGRRNVLAFAAPDGRVRIVDADTHRRLASGPLLGRPLELEWSADGSRLLVLTAQALTLLDAGGDVVARDRFGRGSSGVDAEFVPGSTSVATIRRAGAAPVRSEVVLIRFGGGVRERRIFAGSGRFEGLAYSPAGDRLLVGWRDADQWLFLPADGSGRIETVGAIESQFDAGETASDRAFPRVEGWCCRGG